MPIALQPLFFHCIWAKSVICIDESWWQPAVWDDIRWEGGGGERDKMAKNVDTWTIFDRKSSNIIKIDMKQFTVTWKFKFYQRDGGFCLLFIRNNQATLWSFCAFHYVHTQKKSAIVFIGSLVFELTSKLKIQGKSEAKNCACINGKSWPLDSFGIRPMCKHFYRQLNAISSI